MTKTTKTFDIFLSHNSKDKPTVRKLAEALEARGLKVWLDEWELLPGRPWQEALERIIKTARSSAVLVGKDGLGPWQDAEMRHCLSELVNRKRPVIPVLLPGAPKVPKLPSFLMQLTWVDLRAGLTEEGIDQLSWGATKEKPNRSKQPGPLVQANPRVAEITAETRLYKKQEGMYSDLEKLVDECGAEKAVLIQYSCDTCKLLVRKLLEMGADVTVYIQSPETASKVGSWHQKGRIERRHEDIVNELADAYSPQKFHLIQYSAPASISGVLIDPQAMGTSPQRRSQVGRIPT